MTKKARSEAAKKAWETMRKNPHRQAALKAWRTMRKKNSGNVK